MLLMQRRSFCKNAFYVNFLLYNKRNFVKVLFFDVSVIILYFFQLYVDTS